MFDKLFGRKDKEESGDDDMKDLVRLSYVKLPQSLELKKRQQEEQLLKRHGIKKEKTAQLL